MEEVDFMIPLQPEKEGYRSITTNLFLYCPLCSPAFDALRLYSDKSVFISEMSKEEIYNTTRPGKSVRFALVLQRWE